MKVLVDTCIWSLALRRKLSDHNNIMIVNQLRDLIEQFRVQMIGPIRQEILSGISETEQFNKLRKYLTDFDDLPLNAHDFEKAAEFFNRCRKKGIQGSNTDFLICSVAINNDLRIFTTDKDFSLFAKILPIKLLNQSFIGATFN